MNFNSIILSKYRKQKHWNNQHQTTKFYRKPYFSSWHLLIQTQWKFQNDAWNLFKVNKKDTRTNQWRCSSVFFANFEHILRTVLVSSVLDCEQLYPRTNDLCRLDQNNQRFFEIWLLSRYISQKDALMASGISYEPLPYVPCKLRAY